MRSKSITYVDYERQLSNAIKNAKRVISPENYNLLIKYDKGDAFLMGLDYWSTAFAGRKLKGEF